MEAHGVCGVGDEVPVILLRAGRQHEGVLPNVVN